LFVTSTNKRQRNIIQATVITAVCLFLILWQYQQIQNGRIATAVAKNLQMLTMADLPQRTLNADLVHSLSPALNSWQANEKLQFVQANRLAAGEAQPYGCAPFACAHAIYYNFEAGGTRNAIIELSTGNIVAEWDDPIARPAGSPAILDTAVAIAAADPRVIAEVGDIGAVDPVMIPMSGWLADNACRDEWCVDLTFTTPTANGRVFHVFVNLEQQLVARTFYTRGRPNLDVEMPVRQRGAFQDGCHEQYDWAVCWEMTAHDGINFRNATYQNTPIFDSVKIPQIEAWYPSWPGGYRDEIGFDASVPPFNGTIVTDLGNAFEVRQLFTEFTHWPNCICCYRYEQVLTFYADGAYDFNFVSHGPGCDDLSIYRPFWRIDLAGDSTNVWQWQDTVWQELPTEAELYPFVDQVSPDGFQLATAVNGRLTRWQMDRTHPLGLDEARTFLLQYRPGEGDGPQATGPGDTFQPPRQWLTGDPLTGQNIVLWYVPLLETQKTEPLWCMPDPEPGINQCNARLRAIPGGELEVLTQEQLDAAIAAPPTATPSPTNTPAPTATPRPIEGTDAAELLLNSGCTSCHQIGALGEAHKVGPDLTNIAAVAAERVPGLSAADYVRQSIVEPNAYIVPTCPNGPCIPNIMPQNYAETLSPEQIEILVTYLLEQPAEESLTIIGSDTLPGGKGQPLAKSGSGSTTAVPTSLLVQLFLVIIVFFLTIFLLRARPYDDKTP
jgi:hypothetical protein